MACQYQAVASTRIWRVASWRETARTVSAATSAAMPRKRWTAWATGDEVEEMAARVGGEEDVLRGELIPGDPLAGEEERAEGEGGREPDGGAA